MPSDAIDVTPIDRLSTKIRKLISTLEQTRIELSRTLDDNLRLSRDVEHLKSQLATLETKDTDLSSILEERQQIRSRVSEMLKQLESTGS